MGLGKVLLYGAGVLAGGVALWEGVTFAFRVRRRKIYYEMALKKAMSEKRYLVVIGDPNGAFVSNGCGDVCVDIHGCACPVSITADITKPLPLSADSAVVFVSCVLEYVDDIKAAYAEILRIAGSPENIFIVAVDRYTLTSVFFPGAKWVITEAPPTSHDFVYHRTDWAPDGDGSLHKLEAR